ncbi:MAG: hypothetical protein FJ029_09300 [Actinobacteria bacterium]|nr:hypothetical protein [Actinomycetota bacterium]
MGGDPDFQPDAYWPRLLDVGRSEGQRFGLPIGVVPQVTIINLNAARAAGVEPPPSDARTFTGEVLVEASLALHRLPREGDVLGSPGLLTSFTPEPNVAGVYELWPAPSLMLPAAIRSIRDSQGTLRPLESQAAVAAVALLRDLVKRYDLMPIRRVDFRSYFREGRWGLHLSSLLLEGFGVLGEGHPVYPFPNLGAGRNPAVVWGLLGIPAGSRDPELAYHALRVLERTLADWSIFPSRRVSAEVLRNRLPDIAPADAEMVSALLRNATFDRPSYEESSLINNTIARDVLLGNVEPAEALRRIVTELAG